MGAKETVSIAGDVLGEKAPRRGENMEGGWKVVSIQTEFWSFFRDYTSKALLSRCRHVRLVDGSSSERKTRFELPRG